jgi:hypothetical protein
MNAIVADEAYRRMQSKSLIWLILGASVMDGALAGGGINRALVHMPAWRLSC